MISQSARPAVNGTSQKLLLGLIGSGIGLSLTPAMQEEEARHHDLRLHYQLIDLDRTHSGPELLPTLIGAVRTIGFAGLNVTYPCKQAVIPLLDDLSDDARTMGAVNTVVNRDGALVGHNTDWSGWSSGFERALPTADLTSVVLVGAGGAGAAVAHAVLRLGARRLAIVDTEADRATKLADDLNALYGSGRVEGSTDIGAVLRDATGLINATPIGMAKLPGTPVPKDLLRPSMWVADVVYFPIETELLKAARAAGCATMDGGEMAVGQAVGAFKLFTGIDADAARMGAHLRRMLDERSAAAS
jgi:shikimate dehydrogenase